MRETEKIVRDLVESVGQMDEAGSAMDAGATYSLDDAFALAERMRSERGLMLGLFGAAGFWYAQFIDPLHPERTTLEGYASTESCAEAIRLAAEEVSGAE